MQAGAESASVAPQVSESNAGVPQRILVFAGKNRRVCRGITFFHIRVKSYVDDARMLDRAAGRHREHDAGIVQLVERGENQIRAFERMIVRREKQHELVFGNAPLRPNLLSERTRGEIEFLGVHGREQTEDPIRRGDLQVENLASRHEGMRNANPCLRVERPLVIHHEPVRE